MQCNAMQRERNGTAPNQIMVREFRLIRWNDVLDFPPKAGNVVNGRNKKQPGEGSTRAS